MFSFRSKDSHTQGFVFAQMGSNLELFLLIVIIDFLISFLFLLLILFSPFSLSPSADPNETHARASHEHYEDSCSQLCCSVLNGKNPSSHHSGHFPGLPLPCSTQPDPKGFPGKHHPL